MIYEMDYCLDINWVRTQPAAALKVPKEMLEGLPERITAGVPELDAMMSELSNE